MLGLFVAQSGSHLAFCAVGIQLIYLTWGALQERLMARKFTRTSAEKPAPAPASEPEQVPLFPTGAAVTISGLAKKPELT